MKCIRPPHIRRDDMPYCCQVEYYRTADISFWMNQQRTNKTHTNSIALLDEIQEKEGDHVALSQMKNEDMPRYVVLFAILLDLGRGLYLNLFIRSGFQDSNLGVMPLQSFLEVKDRLVRGYVQDAEKIVAEFHDRVFLYHPLPLESIHSKSTASMFPDKEHGRWIIPYCRRQRVNTKGGTAQVWQAAVPAHVVPTSLASKIRQSEYDDPEYGKVNITFSSLLLHILPALAFPPWMNIYLAL
jgi:hypothetical protein